MSQDKIGIIGTGYYVPAKVLSNADLEKMVDTSDEWIMERTGIRERRIAAPEETVTSMSEVASRKALAAAGIEAADLDLIVVGTITGDRPLPSSACLLQAGLGNNRAASFDVSAACCAFLYALDIGYKFLQSGEYETALIVAAEKLSCVTDWEDRNTCVLFGDGAGAAVIGKGAEKRTIIDCYLGADGSKSYLLEIPAGGSAMPITHEVLDRRQHYIRMEGRETFKIAVSSMVRAARRVLKKNNLTPEDVTWLLPHQANLRIMKAVARGLGIDEKQVYINIERFGNMSGATVSIGLAEMVEKGVLKKDDLLLMVAFGGGLTWASSLIRW